VVVIVMDFNDFKIFLEVKNLRSITKAATSLYLSQSTVSSRIKVLEREIGVPLFVRGRGQKTIDLTAEGEDFIAIAERLLALKEEAQVIKRNDHVHCLKVGAFNSISEYLLPEFYAQLLKGNNAVTYSFMIRHTWQLYDMLEAREIEIGIVNNGAQYPNIKSIPLFREKFVLLRISVEGDVDGKVVKPDELAPEHEIYQYHNPEYAQWHNYWWPQGKACAVIDHSSVLESILYNKQLWIILPFSVAIALKMKGNFTWYDLSEPPPDRTCYVITHKYPKTYMIHAIECFVDQLKAFIQSKDL
jgi:DNA-binding transcriptional LysR family regulator